MTSAGELYEPLIQRDVDAIPAAVRAFRESNSSEDLFLAVARFAILAFAPSQHAKHAVLSSLSAYRLREAYGDRWDDLLTECARYTAESRQPWSEPPLLDPPDVAPDQERGVDALRAAVEAKDRLAGERWLAAHLDDANLAELLFTVAADDFEDLGHKVIVARAALDLSEILGEKGRFAALRIAVWEMTSYSGERYIERGAPAKDLRDRLITSAVKEKGSIEAMHRVFLYEAAKDTTVFNRVCDYLTTQCPRPAQRGEGGRRPGEGPPLYRLAQDYGSCLKAWSIGDTQLIAAAHENLEHGPSFADWSFA